MSERIVELVILAEDLRSFNFLCRYAGEIGIDRRRIRLVPFGQGSGKQHVFACYPSEVREQRRVSGKMKNAALLVHVDADTATVAGEMGRLDSELRKAGQPLRGARERIAIAIPKRHTETWLHGLCGTRVTEQQDCKRDSTLRKSHDAKIGPAVGRLYELTRPNAPAPPAHLPSLAAAIPELRRL